MLHLFEAVLLKKMCEWSPGYSTTALWNVFVHEGVQILWLRNGNAIDLNWHGSFFFLTSNNWPSKRTAVCVVLDDHDVKKRRQICFPLCVSCNPVHCCSKATWSQQCCFIQRGQQKCINVHAVEHHKSSFMCTKMQTLIRSFMEITRCELLSCGICYGLTSFWFLKGQFTCVSRRASSQSKRNLFCLDRF